VHLVASVPDDGSDPYTNYSTIREELRLYSEKLAQRPEIVVLTKMDLTGSEEAKTLFESSFGQPVLAISAVTGRNVNVLMNELSRKLEELGPAQAFLDEPASPVVIPTTDLTEQQLKPAEATLVITKKEVVADDSDA
jgi:GTP-binding protein